MRLCAQILAAELPQPLTLTLTQTHRILAADLGLESNLTPTLTLTFFGRSSPPSSGSSLSNTSAGCTSPAAIRGYAA